MGPPHRCSHLVILHLSRRHSKTVSVLLPNKKQATLAFPIFEKVKKHTTLAFPLWSPSRVLRKLNDV